VNNKMKRKLYKLKSFIFKGIPRKINNLIWKKREDKYYGYMCDMASDYIAAKEKWFYCFHYTLKRWGFNNKSIKDLFNEFLMVNWEALHLENTSYVGYSKEELKESFRHECHYVSDRMSFDRLFRTHWLYLQAFSEDIYEEWKEQFK